MKSRTGKALLVGLLIATASAVACSTGPTQTPPAAGNDQGTGVVGLRLQLAPGVTISTLHWTIHNPALLLADLTGAVDVSHSSAIQFVVGGLPAGAGYTIALTATTDGTSALSCVGSAGFAVVANSTSPVAVTLLCTGGSPDAGTTGSILVSGTATIAPSCAAVTSVSASPSTVDVGSSIALAATAMDGSGNTSGLIFSWAVTGGTGTGSFSSTSSASPSFTCTGAGPVAVTVTATTSAGGTCTNNTQTAQLMCTTPGTDGGVMDTGAPDTGTPDTGTPDTGAPDTGTPDTGTPDTGTPDTGTPDTGVTVTTASILNGRSPACLACVQTSGCLDPLAAGGTCEMVAGNATLLTGPLPDGKTCSAVVGPSPVSETSICLQTLSTIFTSACAASTQATPCLCGLTDTGMCLSGTAVPTGPLFDVYACDFNTTNGSNINSKFATLTLGAGMANSIATCAGSFTCPCF